MFLTTIAVLALLAMIVMHVLKVGIIKTPKLPIISLSKSAVSPYALNVHVISSYSVLKTAC